MTLRAKLVVWYSALFGLSGCVLVTTLYLLIAHRLRSEADEVLAEEFEEWARIVVDELADPQELLRQMRREIETEETYFFRLLNVRDGSQLIFLAGSGIPGAYARELEALRPPPPGGPVPDLRTVTVWHGRRRFRVASGLPDPEGHPELLVEAGTSVRAVEKRITSLRRYLYLSLAVLVVMAAGGGWFLASRSLAPIGKMVRELDAIESGNLADRLEVTRTGGEVEELRRAINRMLERLQRAFERLQAFTANVAHELRTPLTTLQCRIESSINSPGGESPHAVLDQTLRELESLKALVENLLLLARMDAEEAPWDPETVDMARLLEDVGEAFGFVAEEKGIDLALDRRGEAPVAGNAPLLRRMVGNLLDNAIRYTPPGGKVRASVERQGAECVLEVADSGPGIPAESLERVFERFYRAEGSRSRESGGSGLGLSIVKRVVELHGGKIKITTSPGGTSVEVRLPVAERSQSA